MQSLYIVEHSIYNPETIGRLFMQNSEIIDILPLKGGIYIFNIYKICIIYLKRKIEDFDIFWYEMSFATFLYFCFVYRIMDSNNLMDATGGPGNYPRSPVEFKPDTATLLRGMNGGNNSNADPGSPSFGSQYGSPSSVRANSPPSSSGVGGEQYPPNHPLSGSKHFCSICGDRASGKHYGT